MYVTVIVVHIREVHTMICGAMFELVLIRKVASFVVGSGKDTHTHEPQVRPYATACMRLLWLTPSSETSITAVCAGVPCLL